VRNAEDLVTQVLDSIMPKVITAMQGLTP